MIIMENVKVPIEKLSVVSIITGTIFPLSEKGGEKCMVEQSVVEIQEGDNKAGLHV